MKRCFSVLLLLFLLLAIPAMADPPPEDVLNPEPDEYGYLFIQPNFGLNWSSLLTDSVRINNLGERNNPVIANGDGLGFFLGLDFGVVFSEHWGARLGFHFDKRTIGNSGSVDNDCTVIEDFDPITNEPILATINAVTEVDYKLTTHYLTITPTVDFRSGSFFGFAGYAAAIPLSAKYEEQIDIDENSICYYFPGLPDSTKHIAAEMDADSMNTALRHSLRIGAGYIMPLGENTELVFQLGYDHPLSHYSEHTNINYQNTNPELQQNTFLGVLDGTTKFGTLQLSAGVRFNRIIDLW